MKNLTKILLLASMLLLPLVAHSQDDNFNGLFNSTFGTIPGDNFAMDVFTRTQRDYSNATYHGWGMWSGEIDEIIVIGTRIRPFEDRTGIDELLRSWRELSDEQLLIELLAEVEEFSGPGDCSQLLGLADFFRDVLEELREKIDLEIEYGTLFVSSNGDTVLYENSAYTDNSSTSVGHPIPEDASIVVSVVHNHPQQGRANAPINLENRYPSEQDWDAADAYVSAGTDPNILSLTIIDPFGEARVFNYSDRALYRTQSSGARERGRSLPPVVPEDADLGECVKL